MDSSNNNGLSTFRGKISDESLSRDSSGTHGELERVKTHLQQVVKKNQDLEEMLLFTTQELEKERENSRRIVQILTERLMESREIINKLEVENMRYKKDCVLAVELLQCNKSVDQGRVLSTIKKLSDHASKSQVSQNSYQSRTGTISTTENQLTMVNRNEVPSKETAKVFQKPSKTTDENPRNDTKDVENVKTALLREEKPIETSNRKGEQLVSNKQRSSARDKTASAEKESLLTQGEDFVQDTPSLSSGRPNVYKKMPEDDVSATEEDKQYIGENKRQLTEDDRVLVKEDESFAKQKTSLQENATAGLLTSTREPLLQEGKTVIDENNMATKQKPLQTEAKSSLTNDDTKLAKEKTSVEDGELCLAKGDAPQGHDRESLQDTSIMQDNTTTTKDDSLADANKSMENDESPLEEQGKLLTHEVVLSKGNLLEKASSLEINTPAPNVPSLGENSLAEESKLLANDNEELAENEKFLVNDSPPPPPTTTTTTTTTTKEIKAKSSVCQDDTPSTDENSMREDTATSRDREAEDDTFLAEEDTPLV